MARRRDPKEEALAEARCLNPHPEQVTDAEFLASDFFDARDAVQVKYEMVRKARAGGAPVTEAAAAFGYSRPAYYAAVAALESSGLEGLVPARPGPRDGHKLTGQILDWAEEQLAADPALRPAQMPDRIEDAFGVRVHPRSVERALARRRERHSKSRGNTRPRSKSAGLAVVLGGVQQRGDSIGSSPEMAADQLLHRVGVVSSEGGEHLLVGVTSIANGATLLGKDADV